MIRSFPTSFNAFHRYIARGLEQIRLKSQIIGGFAAGCKVHRNSTTSTYRYGHRSVLILIYISQMITPDSWCIANETQLFSCFAAKCLFHLSKVVPYLRAMGTPLSFVT